MTTSAETYKPFLTEAAKALWEVVNFKRFLGLLKFYYIAAGLSIVGSTAIFYLFSQDDRLHVLLKLAIVTVIVACYELLTKPLRREANLESTSIAHFAKLLRDALHHTKHNQG